MKNVFEKVVIFGGLGYFLTRGFFGKKKTDEVINAEEKKVLSYLPSKCGSFKYAKDMLKWSKSSSYRKSQVETFQINANLLNSYRFGNNKKSIKVDGLFGACTQKAALTAFPVNWEDQDDYPNAESVVRALEYINALLKGQPLDKIKLMLPNL